MTLRQIERDICHSQLRLMSTDDQAMADAIRYLTRALMGCFELEGRRQVPAVDELVLRAARGEG